MRRGPAWDCGYPDPSPLTQYTASSFAQPIRRVFGTLVFRAREEVEMPPPGDMRRRRASASSLQRSHLGRALCARRRRGRLSSPTGSNRLQYLTIRHYLSLVFVALVGSCSGACHMALIVDLMVQGAQMLLVLALAPLLTGFVRKVKARLLLRQGPPLIQPYRDLLRLLRKEVVLADNASWLFRAMPYLIFAATWVAAALVPTFATGLIFSWSADLIAIIALLGSARFFLALAGLDVGTSFGGIGSSREVMIASLAEPAMLMIVFTLALVAGSTQLSTIAELLGSSEVGLRVSLGLALIALIMVAIAENARIPIDNPATHLELTMVHEAMVLEYSGRHLALIELAADAQAAALRLADRLHVRALGHAPRRMQAWRAMSSASSPMSAKLAVGGVPARPVRDLDRQDARIPRAGVPRRRADARPARPRCCCSCRGASR